MFEHTFLPFEESALEPHMSARTLSFPCDKHHVGYVRNLNKALEGDERLGWGLEPGVGDSRCR